MELKTYQKQVMDHLADYLTSLQETNSLKEAWKNYWEKQDIAVGDGGVPSYNDAIEGVPHVCMKVPTGGGKTFMACASLKYLFDNLPPDRPKVVVWLVPSNAILAQTVRNLSTPGHPYRQRLERDFQNRVEVCTKEMLLSGQNFSPDTVREMLTVCVLSYDSLRIKSRKKDIRKVYQENGNLNRFAVELPYREARLDNTPDTALMQVLRQLTPVTIVDESHNAGSDLSTEMLNNLNPSFVLDLTATPRKNSNILVYVDARELKKENMVKLPVIVYNRQNRQSVIQDAIQLRGNLEQMAKSEAAAGGRYVRPIVLFQAQPNIREDSETFEKLKEKLIDIGIPEEEIAIKTAEVDELGMVDLLSPDCRIRYIITINALKEGWDCPFAYILASLANKTSKVDVEQILGRILRQPYAEKNEQNLLNLAYVLTSSKDFHYTLESVVRGLNEAGFTRKDYRVGSAAPISDISMPGYEEISLDLESEPVETVSSDDSSESTEADNFSDIDSRQVQVGLQSSANDSSEDSPTLQDMTSQASEQAEQYESELKASEESSLEGGELGNMLHQYSIQTNWQDEIKLLTLPQFCVETAPDLFGGAYAVLNPVHLLEGFSLRQQDATINFAMAEGDMYKVDISDYGEAVPKYQRTRQMESDYLREYLARVPEAKKVNECTKLLCGQLNKFNNSCSAGDIAAYVGRVIEQMDADEVANMETALPVYANKIQTKIKQLQAVYQEKTFYEWLDSGKIICQSNYQMPKIITPADATDSIPKSLYEAERNDMNIFENKVIDAVVGLDNIKWWHRIIDRKDFCINGFINHYPDFLLCTMKGNIILLESKGDYLDGDDSKTKLKLGRRWQSVAGSKYRYFMVFDKRALQQEGAYTLEDMLGVLQSL
ncbi:MAG: DEAD/DEAH box helicase family protein [Megasphaera massiliensis]|uniref:DEAD/DEAH box helicase n=2 Tax=Megasphaera TaxID=906 RepID=UPI00210E1329|nr:DEAD/DEAH box helicase family protein [Megasphaera massiliensis]MCQ5209653.1 DEAD/DEAH box helicase family protein [Megasphaera massiliensis]MEE0658197.1 DEAD/DEAH box helicase family protein [Megasphaera massiliensis]